MATERDKAHFRAIAEYEAAANAESLRADAHRTPGENIELGLKLSEFALTAARQMGATPVEEPKVALITLLRALQARKGGHAQPQAGGTPGLRGTQ